MSDLTLGIVARLSTGGDSRLHGNVESCAPDVHMDLGRFFVVRIVQTSIQLPLQAVQLETQSHTSTVGGYCILKL